MANSEIRSSRLQAAVEVKYTVFHPLVVEVLCVLFLDYARWLGQKQNTRNFYHKRMKDGVVRCSFSPILNCTLCGRLRDEILKWSKSTTAPVRRATTSTSGCRRSWARPVRCTRAASSSLTCTSRQSTPSSRPR